MGRVDGKVAFITGAARGQGRSHALRLAEEGADIIGVDICGPIDNLPYPPATPDDLKETVRQVEALDRRIVAAQADTRDRAGLQRALEDGLAQLGHLDVVVANAGICIPAGWDQVTPQVWQDTIDVNLTGVWNTVSLAAPHLVTRGGGSIIITSSAAGLKGLPFLAPYVASKHGVVGIMRALAHELAEHNIRVNTIHPTGVDTPMGQGMEHMFALINSKPRLAPMFTNSLPVEVTQPVDISNAVLFLASDESRYVTALTFTVDAGNTQF
ncbi:MAG TPA: mycofactocin-coupled SDR family oxidoreductase [Actinomycetota bacterium]|jgi:SDR family mycofactocin-dependent oxidoreductase|nr:mycofactocin-coupled SDR family oxidoreductase [Actinomycetota bacterium]